MMGRGMRQRGWNHKVVKLNYTPISRENFRTHKVTVEDLTEEEGKGKGKCLVLTVPDARGKTVRARMMYEHEHDQIRKEVQDLCECYMPTKVLEVGFGFGYTATQFQECGIEKHVIVEAHPQIADDARKWRAQYPDKDIEIVEEFFQDYIYEEEDYDLIYDDRYELITRDQNYMSNLRRQGFIRRDDTVAGPTFPCWKVIRDRGNKE